MIRLVARTNLYQHSLDVFVKVVPAVACEVKLLKEAEVGVLHEVWPVNLEEMKTRLRRGDLCLACFTDGHLAHYSWVQFSGPHEFRDVGQRFKISLGHCWIYHCRTAEWAKGKQIYPFALTQILEMCNSRGCRHAWIYTIPQNIASQRGIQKAGFSFYKQLASLKIFNFYFPLIQLEKAFAG